MSVPVAVTGIAALLPGSRDAGEFWRCVLAGRDLLTDVPPDRWLTEDHYDPRPGTPDRTYARRGAFLPEVDFDPLRYGIPPNALPSIDTSQLLALLVAEAVLADCADGVPQDRERISVMLGASSLQALIEASGRLQRPVWMKGLRDKGVSEAEAQSICDAIAANYVPWREETFPGLLTNVITGRIANRLDLHGTNYTIDAACASSLAALQAAVDELALGRADLAITGGVDTMNDIMMYTCFSQTPTLSPTGDCRPFSSAADGTMLGEGIVMFALKRLANAERDGDHVYAVIRGIGSSSDGGSTAVYAPQSSGQARALRRAYQDAGYSPATVELVEAHGTGTRAGDAAEFAALRQVFGASGSTDSQWCALGSVKSQVGHTKAAAGATGMLKAVLALHHKILPPTIKVAAPSPELGLKDGPFYLNTKARPWSQAAEHPRRASVSSFGFGGTNFHVALEEYQPAAGSRARPASRLPDGTAELILLSGGSPGELLHRAGQLDTGLPLADTARRVRPNFRILDEARLAVVACSAADLEARLAAVLPRIEAGETSFTAEGIHFRTGPASEGGLAFLFPGQGSQYVGMGADVAMHLPRAQAAWDRAARLEPGDVPLHRVVFPPPTFAEAEEQAQAARLNATEWAQPALAVHGLALLGVLGDLKLVPDCVAGHSFGELVALHAAGAFGADTLIMLARRRGELMRDAARVPGGMLAVMGSQAQAEAAIDGVRDVWIANHNAPGQVALAGTPEALDAVATRLAVDGITTVRLNAAAAFHSPLVSGAAEPLLEVLHNAELSEPGLEVYGGADARVYPGDKAGLCRRLAAQLTSPVRFLDMIEAMYASGARTFVEVGPGAVLAELTRRILGDREHTAICLDRPGRNGVTTLLDGLALLAARGLAMDFGALDAGVPHGDGGATAAHPPEDQKRLLVTIDGGNYGQLYPPRQRHTVSPPEAPRTEADPAQSASPDVAPVQRAPLQPVPLPPAHPNTAPGWLRVVEEAHRQAAEAHAAFQRAMTDSHLAYLRMAEATFSELLGNAADAVPTASVTSERLVLPAWKAEAPAQRDEVPEASGSAADSSATTPLEVGGIGSLLLSVVADRTGYPVEMLNLDMELETDLGIDSIKRVDILSAVRERAGELPGGTLNSLSSLRTLREIAERVGAEPEPESAPVRRYSERAVVTPPSGLAMPGLFDGPVVVTDDGTGVAPLLASRLATRGIAAEVASEVPDGARSVVLLDGLRELTSAKDALAVNLRAFGAARRAAARLSAEGGLFVTVRDTSAECSAWLGLSALVRTARLEWPRAAVKAIDCVRADRPPGALASAIADELLAGGPTVAVALREDSIRLTTVLAAAPVGADDREHGKKPVADGSVLSEDSVVVVTGGARGVTAAAVRALARQYRPRLALIGSTPLAPEPAGLTGAADEPSLVRLLATRNSGSPAEIAATARGVLAVREIRGTLAAIEQTGATVRYLHADVTDGAALSAALQQVRREWGPITGVVHGAGVLADSLIADKTDDQFTRVFGTKAGGLRSLLAAVADDPLTMLCAFSSVAAYCGNPGQSDYAMANEVLNQVLSAEQARRPGCLVRAIGWGPWEGGMVTVPLAERFRSAGVRLIGMAAGADAFAAELAGSGREARIVLVAGDAKPLTAAGGLTAELVVDGDGYGYLADHQPAGVPVVPVATVINWFAGMARAWRPEADHIVLRDLRVLGKVALPRLADGGHRLSLCGHEVADGDGPALDLDLRGDAELPHYRARAAATAPPPGEWNAPGDLTAVPDPYDGVTLFHGPKLRAIRDARVCRAGAEATLAGSHALGWGRSSWLADPAAVDGGLQLGVLWAQRAGADRTLPMGIRECRLYRGGAVAGDIRCVIRAEDAGDWGAECDVALIDPDGSPRIELLGVRLVRRPD
jgi:acyl transferase domain-containing protein/NADP-dependent 3-hydroxy acid dehydrogenase YdfG